MNKLVSQYLALVNHKIKCPHTRKAFHTAHAGSHALYFGAVFTHAEAIYYASALALLILTLGSMALGDAE